MSLIVWLPLNGNLENQGLFQLPASPSTSSINYTDGKIGRAASGYCIYHLSSEIVQNKWSLACWCYSSAWGQYNNILLCNNTKDSEDCRFYFSIIGGSSLNIGINGPSSTASFGFQFSTNTWYHVAATYDGTNYALYINGAKVKFGQCTTAMVSNKLNLGIGGRSMNENGTSATGMSTRLNDVRVYDHCLSAKEVKELAKGLVLHYRLAGPGQENLFVNSHFDSQYSFSGWNTTKNGTQCANNWGGNNMGVGNPTTVYHAHLVEKNGEWVYNYHKTNDENWLGINQSGLQNKVIAGETYIFSCDLYRISGTNGPHGGFYTKTSSSTSNTFVSQFNFISDFSLAPVGKWVHYSQSLTLPKSLYMNDGCNFYIYGMSGGNGEFLMRRPKLEKGSIATPWCPNSADLLYSTLGYNNNIEYDCSGYRRNGTKSGTITWDIDSPRYTTSYKFNTGSDYIKTNFSETMDELSISFWVKPSSSNGGYSIICSNYNSPSGGLWLATNCEGCSVWAYRGAYMSVSGSLTNNVWHHCVYTFKNGVSKWYVDGEEKTLTKNTYTGTTMPVTNLTIGNSYTGTSWNTKRYGNLSDFRLYCTALSAEDIAELYHSAVIVDNTGKTYAYEYFEA